jgi:hypothetical protein
MSASHFNFNRKERKEENAKAAKYSIINALLRVENFLNK